MIEQTLAIIKPDAVSRQHTGAIINSIELANFEIVKMKKLHLSKLEAESFYGVHQGKPFFDELTEFISSGPIVVMVLEKENAVQEWRKLMGATNSLEAAKGTIRRRFGTSINHNASHGSDSLENAQKEIEFFF